MSEPTRIGTIENYYGGLYVKEENGMYYWSLQEIDEVLINHGWERIPRKVYNNLLEFERGRIKSLKQ